LYNISTQQTYYTSIRLQVNTRDYVPCYPRAILAVNSD